MAYKAALFDLDGTLVDTKQEHIYDSVGRTLHELGITPAVEIGDYAVFANHFWKGFSDRDILIQDLGLSPDSFWEVFKKHDSPSVRVANSFVYPDFHVLNQLRERGIKTGIVTDAPDYVAVGELELIGHSFDYIVCADHLQGIPAKPHTAGLLKCLIGLGVSVTEAIYLGNANVDVDLGRNAGIKNGVVVRESGYKLKSTPDFFVKDLVEFQERFFK
ncbi:HAD hydrolase-like protein [Candidatus Pacearchaeota archaeon]|nr:HAD hydrolase-like protein [Candidatus Pacearchaeota archaeon]